MYTTFTVNGRQCLLTIETIYQAKNILFHGAPTDINKPTGLCTRCKIEIADCAIKSCQDFICIECAYQMINNVTIRCACNSYITEIHYFGGNAIEEVRTFEENDYLIVMQVSLSMITNGYSTMNQNTIVENLEISLVCGPQHNYNLRPQLRDE